MICPHCGGYIEDEKPGLIERLWNTPVATFKEIEWEKGEIPPGTKVVNQNVLIIDKEKIKDPNLLRLLEGISD